MGKPHIKFKIVIQYLISLKIQNYTLTKIFIMRQDMIKRFNKERTLSQKKKLSETVGKPKDL